MKRILVILRSEAGFQRDVRRGIGRYVQAHSPWQFLSAPGEDDRLFDPAGLDAPDLDGLLITPTSSAQLRQVQRLAIPAVCMTLAPDMPMVSNDNASIGRLGAEHLLDQGYRRLAYVGGSLGAYAEARRDAFKQICEERDVSCTVLHQATWSHHEAVTEIMAGLGDLKLPCGIMASNDIRGRQVIEAAARLGLAVPEQMGILAVDNDEPICELTTPTLSSIALNGDRVGFEAAAILDRLMRGQTPARTRVFVPPLGVESRQSTTGLIVSDPDVRNALRYIREHPGDAMTTYDILEKVSVGRRSLERRFQEATGRTLFQEIRRVQLEHVKQLLRDTNWPIERIAKISAFKTGKRLRKVFGDELNESPSSFRARHDDQAEL